MNRVRSILLLLVCVLVTRADEPPARVLPPPVEVRPAPETIVIVPTVRVSQYAVWEHYAVDRNGYFRPRVVATSQGGYYSYNGKPFPWTTTNPRLYMPYAE